MIKQLILSLVLSLFLMQINGQNVPLMHTSDAFWEYFRGDCYITKSRIYPIGDTLLNSEKYTIFKNEVYNWEWPCGKKTRGKSTIPPNAEKSTYNTYIKIQDGKIFIRNNSGTDSLIFNSFWNIGDTIVIDEFYDIFYVLSSIDTINLGGVDRRKWTFKGAEFGNGVERPEGIFIEGIGGLYSSLDFLPIGGPCIWSWEYESFSLDCFTLNGNHLLGNNCELGTNTIRKLVEPKINTIVDHKNDILIIQSDIYKNSITKIQIFDLNGKIVLNKKISGTNVSVRYPQYLKGIYLVKIRNPEIIYHQKIFIR